MAKAHGVSPATVPRIWASRGLKPHQVRPFKLPTDPRFEEKLVDGVGLYLNPPDRAVVLCIDEQTPIQALDRTQLALPLRRHRPPTVTHDDQRNGTPTLFGALNVATGPVIGQCVPRHRHEEFLDFLAQIDRKVPRRLAIHAIVDHDATHKHEAVRDRLAEHSRFPRHFTPTSSSWLSLVERWFRDLTVDAVRRGAFRNVPALIAAIHRYIATRNAEATPLVWTAGVDHIRAKVKRGRVALQQVQSQLDPQK